MKNWDWWCFTEIRRDPQAQRVCSTVGGSSRWRQCASCRLGQSRVGRPTSPSTTSVSGIVTWNLSLSSSPVDAVRWETWYVLIHATVRYLTRVCTRQPAVWVYTRQKAVQEVRGSCSCASHAPPFACQTYGIEYPTGYSGSHFQHLWQSHLFALVLSYFPACKPSNQSYCRWPCMHW